MLVIDGECQTDGGPIDNVKSSGVYTIGNFCGVKFSNNRVL